MPVEHLHTHSTPPRLDPVLELLNEVRTQNKELLLEQRRHTLTM